MIWNFKYPTKKTKYQTSAFQVQEAKTNKNIDLFQSYLTSLIQEEQDVDT